MDLLITDVLYYLCQKLDTEILYVVSRTCKRLHLITRDLLAERKKKRYSEERFLKVLHSNVYKFKEIKLTFDNLKKEVLRITLQLWPGDNNHAYHNSIVLTETAINNSTSIIQEYNKLYMEEISINHTSIQFKNMTNLHISYYIRDNSGLEKLINRLQYLFTELYRRNYNLRN